MNIIYSDKEDSKIHSQRYGNFIIVLISLIVLTILPLYLIISILAMNKSIIGVILFSFFISFILIMLYGELRSTWKILKSGIVLTNNELKITGINILLTDLMSCELVELEHGGLCLIVKYQKEDEIDFIRIVKDFTSDVSVLTQKLRKLLKEPEQFEILHFASYSDYISAHS